MADLIKEFIHFVIEGREEDFWKIESANQSFDDILNYIKGLNKDLRSFERVFKKSEGFFTGFSLGSRIRRTEHVQLSVYFMDRELFGAKSKLNAQAVRIKARPESATSTKLKGFLIGIYFNAPPEARVSPRSYNKWLASNLETILDDQAIRSSYVHEFIHVMDFKRMDPAYLQKRTDDKQKDLETQQATGIKRDFGKYVNDPLELNAYFSQAMSDVKNAIELATTPEEKRAIVGSSPQEFADKFMNVYLKKQVRKNISPENQQRLMKRAATSWDLLNQA
jgi:hypothetical protein